MADVQTLLRVGKQALDANKVQEAVTLLSAASSQAPNAPQTWFYLAAAFAKQQQHDMSCLCFLRVLNLVQDQKKAPQPLVQMRNAAADNLWLQASRVLPPGWSTSLTDVDQSSAWSAAARIAAGAAGGADTPASSSSDAAVTTTSGSSGSDGSMPKLWCIGGLGLQALLLADAASAAAAAASSSQGDLSSGHGCSSNGEADPTMHAVAFMPTNQLSAQLFDQVVKVNGLQGSVTVIDRQQAKAWAGAAAAAAAKDPSTGQQQQEQLQGLMLPAYCRAQCELSQLLLQLQQLAPLLGPATAVYPSKVVIKGYLAAAPHLVALNRVNTTHLVEDTTVTLVNSDQAPSTPSSSSGGDCGPAASAAAASAAAAAAAVEPSQANMAGASAASTAAAAAGSQGLDLSTVNAVLQRPQRPTQVSRFQPLQLTPVTTLLQMDLQQLVSNRQLGQPSVFDQLQQQVVLTVENPGSADCMVWWMEYEVTPGVYISYAPSCAATSTNTASSGSSSSAGSGACQQAGQHQEQQQQEEAREGSTPDVLQPHRWQYVAYFPDNHGHPPPPPAAAGKPAGGSGAGDEKDGAASNSRQPLAFGMQVAPGDKVTVHTRVTPAGASVRVEANPASSGGGGAENSSSGVHKSSSSGSAAAAAGGGDLLPYHMSMLNDRARTRAYAAGIAGCVQQLLQANPPAAAMGAPCSSSGSDLPVVLDVGAGTGLLSMLAAKAGAPVVVGCEREPLLASVAQQLLGDNGLQQQVAVVRKLSSQLTVAPPAPPNSRAQGGSSQMAGAAPPVSAPGTTSKSSAAAGVVASAQTPAAATAAGPVPDLPAPAALVVHEIFGTDPLSERVLPTMAQVQAQLCRQGTLFLPKGFRVVAALACCNGLAAFQRLQVPRCHGAESASPRGVGGGAGSAGQAAALARTNTSSSSTGGYSFEMYAPLLPRKVEVQLDELGDQLQLLTAPAAVAAFDLEEQWPVSLQGQSVTELGVLERPLLLDAWMQQQEQAQAASSVPAAAGAGSGAHADAVAAAAAAARQLGAVRLQGDGVGAGTKQQQQQQEAALVVVSWFEADCGAGGWLSTRPGCTYYGHWQQSVELLPPGAGQALARRLAHGEDRVRVAAKWAVDRIMFTVE